MSRQGVVDSVRALLARLEAWRSVRGVCNVKCLVREASCKGRVSYGQGKRRVRGGEVKGWVGGGVLAGRARGGGGGRERCRRNVFAIRTESPSSERLFWRFCLMKQYRIWISITITLRHVTPSWSDRMMCRRRPFFSRLHMYPL